MLRSTPRHQVPPAQLLAQQAIATLERFLHSEAVSGVALLLAAAVALIWADSPNAHSYHTIWDLPLAVGLGSFALSQTLHFWINDGLMTVFFLVAVMEIRRQIHEGAWSEWSQALLPVAAAVGGVIAPAAIFLRSQGWAVPTATAIAFAVGALALLGRSIPWNPRIFLLPPRPGPEGREA
jgi:NhaA family Na+:H+ antiporter